MIKRSRFFTFLFFILILISVPVIYAGDEVIGTDTTLTISTIDTQNIEGDYILANTNVTITGPLVFNTSVTRNIQWGGTSYIAINGSGLFFEPVVTFVSAVTYSGGITYSGDVNITGTNRLYFRDTGIYIYSFSDGNLNITSDTAIYINGATTFEDSTTYASGSDIDFAMNTIFVDDAGSATNRFLRTDTGNMNLWMNDITRDMYVIGYNTNTTGVGQQLGPNFKIIGDYNYSVPALAFYTTSDGGVLGDTQVASLLGDGVNVNLYAFQDGHSLAFLTYDSTPDGVGAKMWIASGDTAEIKFWSSSWFRIYADEGSTETFAINGQTGEIFVRNDIVDGDIGKNNIGGTSGEFNNAYFNGTVYFFQDQGEFIYSTGSDLRLGSGSDELYLSSTALGPVTSSIGLRLGDTNNEWGNIYTNGSLYFFDDQEEYIYSDNSSLIMGVGNSDEMYLSTVALGPSSAMGLRLGGVNNEWGNMYTNGSLYFFDDQAEYIYSDNSSLIMGVSTSDRMYLSIIALGPSSATGLRLGGVNNEWGNIYTNGTLYFNDDQGESIYSNGSALIQSSTKISGDLEVTGTSSLGTIAFTGNLSMGTNFVLMAADDFEWIRSTGTDVRIGLDNSDQWYVNPTAMGPITATGLRLGGVDNEWGNIYTNGTLYFYDDQGESIYSNGSALIQSSTKISGDLEVTGTSSLGTIAFTGNISMGTNFVLMAVDDFEWIRSTGTDIRFGVGNSDEVYISTTAIGPVTAGGTDLGGVSNEFKDIFLNQTLYFFQDQAEYIYSDGTDLILASGGAIKFLDNLNMNSYDLDNVKNIIMQGDLLHDGDTDTKIAFTDDKIRFEAGAVTFVDFTEAGSDVVTWGSVTHTGFNISGNYLYMNDESVRSTGSDIRWAVDGTDELYLSSTSLGPTTAGGTDLGGSSNEFSNLFLNSTLWFFQDQAEYIYSDGTDLILASGGVIKFLDDLNMDGHTISNSVWGATTFTGDINLDNVLSITFDDSGNTARDVLTQTSGNSVILTNDAGGSLVFRTRDTGGAASLVDRMIITGAIDTSVATWDSITHTGFVLSGNLLPSSAGDIDLGSATLELRDIFLNASLYFYDDQQEWIYSTGSDLRFASGGAAELYLSSTVLGPVTAGGLRLGDVNNEFGNIYTNGTLYFYDDQGESIYSDGTDLIIDAGNRVKIGTSMEISTLYRGINNSAIIIRGGAISHAGASIIIRGEDNGGTITINTEKADGTELVRLFFTADADITQIDMFNANFDINGNNITTNVNNTGSIGEDAVRIANAWFTTITSKASVTGKVIEMEIAPAPWETFVEGDIVKVYDEQYFVKTKSKMDYVLGVVTPNPQQVITGYNITWEIIPNNISRVVESWNYVLRSVEVTNDVQYTENVTDDFGNTYEVVKSKTVYEYETFVESEMVTLVNGSTVLMYFNSSRIKMEDIYVNETITTIEYEIVYNNITTEIPIYEMEGSPVVCVAGEAPVRINEPVVKNDIIVAGPDGVGRPLRVVIEELKVQFAGTNFNWNNVLEVIEAFSMRTLGSVMEDSNGPTCKVMIW